MMVNELMTYNVGITKNLPIVILGQIQTLDDNKLLPQMWVLQSQANFDFGFKALSSFLTI
jgi:hypothetical protein